MHPTLAHDLEALPDIASAAQALALDFLRNVDDAPAARTPSKHHDEVAATDAVVGIGAAGALERFRTQWLPHLAGSAGPRYLGFVTGGSTPASLVGDWITSTVDQNPTSNWDSEAPSLERETVASLAKWFHLPSHTGVFVTGATMSNFVGLAIAREWVGERRGVQVSTDGLAALGPVRIFGGTPHSSVYKAASMLGLGRSAVHRIPTLPGREAIDIDALDAALASFNGVCIVVASAGTVNTGDFDDLVKIAALKKRYDFWLHVDGAFGAFAALDASLAPLVAGMDDADSVCIDCHKWMNVPYDSALQFSRRQDLQVAVFQNAAAYLGGVAGSATPNFVHLTPENSRRWRALAAWFSVVAYGRDGHAEIVSRNVECARLLATRLDRLKDRVTVVAPVRLNVVLFTVRGVDDEAKMMAWLRRLTDTHQVFLTPTIYNGQWGVRAAFSNWRTTSQDVDIALDAIMSVL